MVKGGTTWYVYMVRCSDGSLYTGITNDLEKRLRAHNSAKDGARYTRSRRPVTLVYAEEAGSKSSASRLEYQIKRLSRSKKKRLITSTAKMKKERQMAAYLVGHITIKDDGLWQKYVDGVGESLAPFDSRIIFRGQLVRVLAGQHEHDLVVVIEFPDQSTLDAWFSSEKYQKLIPLRDKAADVVITTYKT
jgi:predicted GIY-YIG superfamily endonuclease